MKYIGVSLQRCFGWICLFFVFGSFLILPDKVGSVQAQEVIFPYGAGPTDPDLKNLEWNRYVVDNFSILSIDNGQGKWLSENLASIRQWCLTRWGFPESKLTKECRLFCVPNKPLLKKLFGLEQSKFEIRKDVNVIWLVLDDKPAKVIPPHLTQICFSEFETVHNIKIGLWFKRGSAILNGPTSEVRQNIASLDVSKAGFLSEKMFTMTEDDYNKETFENRKLYDQQAVILCILLRKEFGEAKLQGFLRLTSRNNPQDVLKVIYGFSGYSHFDRQYIRFTKDLNSDIVNNKTPDSYLEIKPVR